MKEEYDKKKVEEENLEKTVTPKALMKKVDGQFEKMEQEVCRYLHFQSPKLIASSVDHSMQKH